MDAYYIEVVSLLFDQSVDEFGGAENIVDEDVVKEADVCSPLS